MENYKDLIQHLEKITAILAPEFEKPEPPWTLKDENITPGAFGGEIKNWFRGEKNRGFYCTVTTSFDEEGLPEETETLIWPTGLPGTLSVSIQSAPDFFDPKTEQISLNLTAPAVQLSEILAIDTEKDDGFSFFKKLIKRCFPGFSVEEESWEEVEAPDPLDDSQSTEGTMVHVMGSETSGFRRTVESYSKEESTDKAATETVIFTASGLPEETEMTMSAGTGQENEEQQFSLHITASGDIFKKILESITDPR